MDIIGNHGKQVVLILAICNRKFKPNPDDYTDSIAFKNIRPKIQFEPRQNIRVGHWGTTAEIFPHSGWYAR